MVTLNNLNGSWRVVKTEIRDAFMNMAIDEAVSEHIAENKSHPTIRFYRWSPSAVSIGCFQSMDKEVNVARCKELGIDYIRRRTGGGAVYHDFNGEITYSVIAPESIMPKGITDSYQLICGWIVISLAGIGIQSEFKPINDIIVAGKKISGNAQTRRRGVLLQHGTILYDLDVEKMFSVLQVGREKISDKMIASVKERVTRVLDHADASREELEQALLNGFTAEKIWSFGQWTESELKRAEELANSRYKSNEWTFMR